MLVCLLYILENMEKKRFSCEIDEKRFFNQNSASLQAGVCDTSIACVTGCAPS